MISFHRKDTAFIIAVSGGAGAAEDFEAVGLEAGRQRIHLLPTADAERDVRVSGAGGFFGGICQFRLIRVFNKTLKSVLFGRRIAASGHCR